MEPLTSDSDMKLCSNWLLCQKDRFSVMYSCVFSFVLFFPLIVFSLAHNMHRRQPWEDGDASPKNLRWWPPIRMVNCMSVYAFSIFPP